ncbi:hypothetical protein [uncultured Corynebacterium sp.]|uniref:hypothetical protein n=1 Tax=uncultured Corynebacterium sp. TaxID=159447 RepID=UPI0025CF8B47|nr:hypothetical protein [uncultured Corynebacterium sp.]
MSYLLHFFRPTDGILLVNSDMAEAFAHSDLDRLRQPDESMDEAARDIAATFLEPVEAQQLITVECDWEAPRVLEATERLAVRHGLMVFLGDSGVLVNYAALADTDVSVTICRNSVGTVSKQVSHVSLNDALVDALRADDPWVDVIALGDDPEDGLGQLARMIPRPDATVEVRLHGDSVAQSLVVDSVERAVHLLMLFADRCPALNELPWTEAVDELAPMHDFAERLAMPRWAVTDLQRLAPGLKVTIPYVPHQPLRVGPTADGKWELEWLPRYHVHLCKEVDTVEEVASIIDTYRVSGLDEAAGQWMRAADAWGMPMWSVSAAELPDRDAMWREDSVVAFHEQLRLSTAAPSALMTNFVEEINARIGHEILVAEQRLEAASAVTIMVPVDVAPVTIERLIHVAEDRNVSLVVNGEHVLFNPSGRTSAGRDRCELSLQDSGGAWVRRWNDTNVGSLLEAVQSDIGACTLEVRSPRTLPVAERSSMWADFRGGEEPGFEVVLVNPQHRRSVHPLSLAQMVNVFYAFPQGVEVVEEGIYWDSTDDVQAESEVVRWVFNSSRYEPMVFTAELAEQLKEVGLPAVGEWVAVNDRVVAGDYCQVDRVGDTDYLVEWGHELGEVENFQYRTAEFAQAVDRLVMFSFGDRAAFEALEWTHVRS